jgi:hypothetical protein
MIDAPARPRREGEIKGEIKSVRIVPGGRDVERCAKTAAFQAREFVELKAVVRVP